MYWEMYGLGSTVVFWGRKDDEGYRLTVKRDDTTVLTALASDPSTLFRHSRELRRYLQDRGFTSSMDEESVILDGGPCWGPATPLTCSIVDCLK